jgi:dipeptidyl aminopeptidase/acylaminoacyl peptidase
MISIIISLALGSVAPAWWTPSTNVSKACADFAPGNEGGGKIRPVSALDLATLRDFGSIVEDPSTPAPFSISPDGAKIALVLRRGNPAENAYCLALVILDRRTQAVRVLDFASEYIPEIFDKGNLAGYQDGMPNGQVPLWSPDGRWIAYLKRQNGVTHLWQASISDGRVNPVTDSPIDVDKFSWTDSGATLVYSVRSGLRAARAAIAGGGLSGHHYDERYVPDRSSVPFPRAPTTDQFYSVDAGIRMPATAAERALLGTELPPGSVACVLGIGGARACVERRSPVYINSPTVIRVHEHGETIQCSARTCDDHVAAVFWSADYRSVYYLRREGWADSSTALYQWRPSHRPRLVLRTDDLLFGCRATSTSILCARETATAPRHIVTIEPRTGHMATLFNPNPEFATLTSGQVERLHWRNAYGIETFGDLILPANGVATMPLPLVVVGYDSRGFLRGGTGDEYPIQAFAARGFAVLRYQRPKDVGLLKPARTISEIVRRDNDRWRDRRSVLSSLEVVIRQLISRGLVDPHRIGITGFSDGASNANFAILNSSLFAVASMSSCCEDPFSVTTVVGPALSEAAHGWGYPRLTSPNPAFWQPISLAANAERVRIPILLQQSDREYLFGLQTVSALRELGRPIDLFVYPDEYHIKWQPAHRLAIYRRNLRWFDFWLKGEAREAGQSSAEYARWQQWRSSGRVASASQPRSGRGEDQ